MGEAPVRHAACGQAARCTSWYRRHRRALQRLWGAARLGVLGVANYLLLLNRYRANHSMTLVILTAAVAYLLTLAVHAAWIRRRPRRRRRTARLIRTVFRLLYTALYLTAIMLDTLSVSARQPPGYERVLSWYGLVFLGVALWGTNCLWLGKLAGWLRRLWRLHAAKTHRRAPAPQD